MLYEIYVDGACSRNPGKGGYAFIILCNKNVFLKVRGKKEKTTNNEMELTAIVKSLKHIIKKPDYILENDKIIIYSDSAYCINSINQKWINSWSINGWKNKDGKEIKNKELWVKLYDILKYLDKNKAVYKFVKVKGHSGDKYNEMVDYEAKLSYKMEV